MKDKVFVYKQETESVSKKGGVRKDEKFYYLCVVGDLQCYEDIDETDFEVVNQEDSNLKLVKVSARVFFDIVLTHQKKELKYFTVDINLPMLSKKYNLDYTLSNPYEADEYIDKNFRDFEFEFNRTQNWSKFCIEFSTEVGKVSDYIADKKEKYIIIAKNGENFICVSTKNKVLEVTYEEVINMMSSMWLEESKVKDLLKEDSILVDIND